MCERVCVCGKSRNGRDWLNRLCNWCFGVFHYFLLEKFAIQWIPCKHSRTFVSLTFPRLFHLDDVISWLQLIQGNGSFSICWSLKNDFSSFNWICNRLRRLLIHKFVSSPFRLSPDKFLNENFLVNVTAAAAEASAAAILVWAVIQLAFRTFVGRSKPIPRILP